MEFGIHVVQSKMFDLRLVLVRREMSPAPPAKCCWGGGWWMVGTVPQQPGFATDGVDGMNGSRVLLVPVL